MKYNILYSQATSSPKIAQSSLVVRTHYGGGKLIRRIYVSNDLNQKELAALCRCTQKMHDQTDLDLDVIVVCCLL